MLTFSDYGTFVTTTHLFIYVFISLKMPESALGM